MDLQLSPDRPVGRGLSEIELVQNGALGAIILWKFGIGYQAEASEEAPVLPLYFLVLPICLHEKTFGHLKSTQLKSGLTQFASKVGESPEELYAIHLRAQAFRDLTLNSVALGIRSELFTVHYRDARVRANIQNFPVPPERLKHHLSGAEKLGRWCARMPLDQIPSILKLEF